MAKIQFAATIPSLMIERNDILWAGVNGENLQTGPAEGYELPFSDFISFQDARFEYRWSSTPEWERSASSRGTSEKPRHCSVN